MSKWYTVNDDHGMVTLSGVVILVTGRIKEKLDEDAEKMIQ